ncbi:hypothetical protein D3C77_629980 [compost metagenome]
MAHFAQHSGLAQAVGDIAINSSQGLWGDFILVLCVRAHSGDMQTGLQMTGGNQ